MKLSKHNIFVSFKNLEKTGLTKNASLIPCGVNTSLFVTSSKEKASKKLGLTSDKKHILFAGAFDDSVKNSGLALEAVSLLENTELLELKGYTRQQVVFLMNAVDVALMTSFTEGSPQFIKEAMACNCPVVSVPVGDVPENIKNLTGCYITTYEPDDVAEKLLSALEFGERTKGRDRIIELGLDIESVANRILGVYEKVKK
jgi:glycosyltransferase involved in cell wall biosynthesis